MVIDRGCVGRIKPPETSQGGFGAVYVLLALVVVLAWAIVRSDSLKDGAAFGPLCQEMLADLQRLPPNAWAAGSLVLYFSITGQFAMLRGWERRDPPYIVWVLMMATLYLIVSTLFFWPLSAAVDHAVFASYYVARLLVIGYGLFYCNPVQLYTTYNTVLSTFPLPAAHFRNLISSRTECKLVVTKPLDPSQQPI